MQDLLQEFEDRLQEIEEYLKLLDVIEKQVQNGIPRIELRTDEKVSISVNQQKILYSSVFLQLYNLIEATMTKCIDGVTEAIKKNKCKPNELSEQIRKEWICHIVDNNNTTMNAQKRLNKTISLYEHVISSQPVLDLKIKKPKGNWDDKTIEEICERLGLSLNDIEKPIVKDIKRRIKNDDGSLSYIKNLRNQLAHGSISFVECADIVTVKELRDLKERTASYLREIVKIFKHFIDSKGYIISTPTE